MATGLEHSSTGADRRIIHIGVIHECVSDVEGRGISARNAGQLVHLPLTNRYSDRTLCVLQHFPCPFSTAHAIWTTASERFSSSPPPQPMPPPPSPAYSPSQPKPLHYHSMNRRCHPRSLTGTLDPGPSRRTSLLQATLWLYM